MKYRWESEPWDAGWPCVQNTPIAKWQKRAWRSYPELTSYLGSSANSGEPSETLPTSNGLSAEVALFGETSASEKNPHLAGSP